MRSSLLYLTLGLGLVAACGDDGTNHLADAPTIDGTKPADAPLVDAATLPVTLTVTDNGSAATGIKVYFLESDSTLVSNTMTDANGQASAIVKAGGSVTAVVPEQQGTSLLPGTTLNLGLDTFADVKPGDSLHLDLTGNVVVVPTSITFDVTVASAANATDYKLETTCGSADLTPPPEEVRAARAKSPHNKVRPLGVVGNQPTVSVTLQNCRATEDVLVAAFDDSGTLVASAFLPAQQLADGQAFTFAGPYDATTGVLMTLSHPSAVFESMNLDGAIVTAKGEVFDASVIAELGSGAGSDELQSTLGLPPAGSLGSTTLEAFFMNVNNNDTVFDQQELLQWGAPADSKLIDLSTLTLADYASGAQFDATTQQLQWTVGATGLAPDAVLAVIDVSREAEGVPDGTFEWSIAALGTHTGAIQFPTLPTDLFNFVIGPSDGVTVQSADTAKVPGGYDAIRAHVFAFQPTDLITATPGTASFTSLLEEERPSVRKHRAWAHRAARR